MEADKRAVSETTKILKGEVERIATDRQKDQEEIVRFVKGLNEALRGEIVADQQSLAGEVKEVKKRVEQVGRDKMGLEEARATFNEQAKVIKMKADLDEVQSSLNAFHADTAAKILDQRDEILAALKNQNLSLVEQLSKKPNALEMKKQLAGKIDTDSIGQLLDNYLKSIQFEGLVEQVRALDEKVEACSYQQSGEVEGLLPLLKQEVGEVKRGLVEKANIQEVFEAMDKKCGRRG